MISNIQILRAIAAILVVAFHTVLAAKSYNLPTEFFYKVDIWGAAGVDIFFIISGFIMVYIQINKKKKPLDFLKDRIESILNQTYGNLEIILVDDGSPDSCGKICEKYALSDSRVKVVHQKNAGVAAARNVGLDLAEGDYVTFVDSDDYIQPQMYEKMIS